VIPISKVISHAQVLNCCSWNLPKPSLKPNYCSYFNVHLIVEFDSYYIWISKMIRTQLQRRQSGWLGGWSTSYLCTLENRRQKRAFIAACNYIMGGYRVHSSGFCSKMHGCRRRGMKVGTWEVLKRYQEQLAPWGSSSGTGALRLWHLYCWRYSELNGKWPCVTQCNFICCEWESGTG